MRMPSDNRTRLMRLRSIAAVLLFAALIMTTSACGERRPPRVQARPPSQTYSVTAYCQRGLTASGAAVRDGIVAADPSVLPLGTVIRVGGLARPYNREYRVLDTGRAVRGRHIDLYVANCREAIRFGRRRAIVSVVRDGSTP